MRAHVKTDEWLLNSCRTKTSQRRDTCQRICIVRIDIWRHTRWETYGSAIRGRLRKEMDYTAYSTESIADIRSDIDEHDGLASSQPT